MMREEEKNEGRKVKIMTEIVANNIVAIGVLATATA